MIKIKIDVTKINKERLFKGEKGTYLSLVLFDKPDKYGNAGFISEDITKEQRESGVKGNIIGNWKDTSKSKPDRPPSERKGQSATDDDSDLPF